MARSATTVKPEADTPRTRGPVTKLPVAIASDADVEWPGQSKTSANAALKAQITSELQSMSLGSVRRYDIADDKEQKAFIALFRSCVAVVHPSLGARVVVQNGAVFVKLDTKIERKRNGS